MDGKVVYYRIYDMGGMVDLARLKMQTTEKLKDLKLTARSFAPDYVTTPPCVAFSYPAQKITTPLGDFTIVPEIKVFSIGAVSICVRVDFEKESLDDLKRYFELRVVQNGKLVELDDLLDGIFEKIRKGISFALTDTYSIAIQPENYVVFCVHDTDNLFVQEFLTSYRKDLAGLLTNRKTRSVLSDREVADVVSSWFSYEDNDLVVIDWEAALLVNPRRDFEDVLLILEIGNLMLLEMQAYDAYLNKILDKAYQDIDTMHSQRMSGLGGAKQTMRDIINTRIDLLKMTDELENTTKFVGEWYLAKVHKACADKFHLKDWETIVDKKLETLNDMYTLINNAIEGRKMLILEIAIVLLFVIDLAVLAIPYFI